MWKRRAVDYLIKKIDLDGTTARKPGTGRPKSARTTENVDIVRSPDKLAYLVHQCTLNIACKLISTILCD